MSNFFRILSTALSTYWASSFYQWLFLLGLIVIFFKEKNPQKRHALFWYPLLTYLFLLSPIFTFVGNKAWGGESIPYMCRQFSLVPVFFVIACAGTLIVKDTSEKRKLLFVGFICCFLIVFGSGLIYTNEGYRFRKSQNAYKIPSDLIEICDYMDSVDEDPVVACGTDLAYQARQYDASLHLLVGARDTRKISQELESETPDVSYIMAECCKSGGDFVIIKNAESVANTFSDEGYTPCYTTNEYLVYECGGYEGVKISYTPLEQVLRITYYDENGQNIVSEDMGYSQVEYVYDNNGNTIKEFYFDPEGNPMAMQAGYYGTETVYNDSNDATELIYLDANGNPVTRTDGYARMLYSLDESGRAYDIVYADSDGNPTVIVNGCSGYYQEFDEQNRISSITYHDLEGKECMIYSKYSKIVYQYDDDGRETQLLYDVNGELFSN